MIAAEIARAVLSRGTTTNGEQIVCVDGLTIEDIHVLCRAVLDAEAYRARVEAVATEMRVTGESARPFGSGHLRDWAAQLTEKGNG